MKPFRPPTLVTRKPSMNTLHSHEPPAKKRRLNGDDSDDDERDAIAAAAAVLKASARPNVVNRLSTFRDPVRKPLDVVRNPSVPSQTTSNDSGVEGYFTVLWRKYTTKKNKTWDGDGVLSVVGGQGRLQDVSGRELGRSACKGPLLVGSELSVGGKEIEVESMISRADFLAGRPFLGNVKESAPAPSLKEADGVTRVAYKAQAKYKKLAASQSERPNGPLVASTKATHNGFRTPLLHNNVQAPQKDAEVPIARHDPLKAGSLVMKRPNDVPKGKQIVDVVVDPLLTDKLRDHQRAGVAFMYECVMGMKGYDGEGAILADEMGLGKTLQTIALVWTLLKQNPIYKDAPVIKKAMIVCPVTLIQNWQKEFRKWLGKDRIGVFVISDKNRLTDFTKGRNYSVMIIGYEKLRMVQADLQKCPDIDIVIADEGHRMKTAQNKAAMAIKSLKTERRIILSGTPIQNDLTEFYTMVDFVNPGLLNKYNTFRKEFETPILKSRQPGASEKDLEKGEARATELAEMTGKFILRRTADLLSKYLPPKTEYVVFCRPTDAQAECYRSVIGSSAFNAALGSPAATLELINVLKKICNSPTLLLKKNNKGEDITKPELIECVPPSLMKSPGASGKLQVLDSLLHRISTATDEKVVLVSNYTSTMDILGALVTALGYNFLRLDGSTPVNKRQDLVDRFNRSPQSNSFVFLLSAKAGGVGLNLIGASRLILFDLDWNPATDLQAMARVHRDGQKKPCYIYRFVTQGALDEKIFQRQVSKTGLADSIVDGKGGVSGFTREELKNLFSLDEGEDCQTHKLMACECGGSGVLSDDVQDQPELPGRNDLASLGVDSDGFVDIDAPETLYLDDDSDDEPIRPKVKLLKGSQVDMAAQEEEIRRNKRACKDSGGKAKMLSLMQYSHFDTANVSNEQLSSATMDDVDGVEPASIEVAIEDDILRSVIREKGRRIGFVFAKTSS